MAAKIHVERMMHRDSVAVTGESAATYALLKLIPSGEGVNRRLRLNLGLALDVSGSMYEEDETSPPRSRLQRVQQAVIAAVASLQPDDTLAVVAFGHDARLLLPATAVADREAIEDVIRRIDEFDVDPGGTAMDQGLSLALEELRCHSGPSIVTQLVVLTDGESTGEQSCREQAATARNDGIRLTFMGIGTDWKSEFIKELAGLGGGKWYYIDPSSNHDALRVFTEEFQTLASTGFANVEIHLRPVKDVKVKRFRQVSPEIRDVRLGEPEPRHLVASLGNLERGKTSRYVIDLSVPRRPDGNYVIVQSEVTYDLGIGQRESGGHLPLEVRYSASGNGYVNAEVAKHIDEVQIYEMNDNLQKAIATENQAEVLRLAQGIAKKGELMGPRAVKKTMLAKQVLQEINVGGRVTKKTRLAVDDAARAGG